jgi:hypothetical protein
MPSTAELTQLVIAVATLVSAIAAVIVSLRNKDKIDTVHDLVNSQSHALNTLTASSSKAEGVLQERERAQKERE